MGIEETPVDHYESLMQRLWTIPSESVLKTTEVLGNGNFGKVEKGYILRGESKIEAALHAIEGKLNLVVLTYRIILFNEICLHFN